MTHDADDPRLRSRPVTRRGAHALVGSIGLVGRAIPEETGDRDGEYSMYTVADANDLRGVQPVDANGLASFTSVFPAAYSGRWPHVHFEIYPSVDTATSDGSPLATSQIALRKDVCDAAYATDGYEQSASRFATTSIETDMVFSDGVWLQTPSMTGNATNGFVSSLVVGVPGTV
jgi:hypothetical protein